MTAADQGSNGADSAAPSTGRMQSALGPAGRQLLVNLKVWAPYFSNRIDRDRLVRFSAVDERVGLKWTCSLPRQCWSCGRPDSLAAKELKRLLRAYENPVAILTGTAIASGIALLLVVLAPGISTLLLLALALGIGLTIFKLKSWEEDVRLVFWSCPEHASELQPPEMVIEDQQLCVFLPTVELADATRAAIRAKRKQGLKPYEGAEVPPDDEPPRPRRPRTTPAEAAVQPYAPPPPPPPVELPPIRLAGEEDEAPT